MCIPTLTKYTLNIFIFYLFFIFFLGEGGGDDSCHSLLCMDVNRIPFFDLLILCLIAEAEGTEAERIGKVESQATQGRAT